ncbi:hypothetical protein F2Q69_00029131 [Brassica cretica]|uniref:Uncharacterized protein n=1 Tax=Brassica cretica TaxID=69181 RepID=A0A8S9S9U5_BRACR|nr:hypothetical protein F2Q69_00029131 [Brassica cretica]
MSQGISDNAQPTIFNRETVRDQRGEVVQEIELVAHSVDPAKADAYWVATCNVEEPPPEPWVPVRPFSERVVGRPSRCTLPFLGTISPRGIKHLVGLLFLGYERGMELTVDYLEAFLTLSQVGTDRLYGFKPRTYMEVQRGFSQGDRGWKSYFFYVRLDQASAAVECLPSFRRLWGVGVHNPIPPFPEDLFVVRNLLRGGPLFWGHFSPERVRSAVETHRSRFSSTIDDDMGMFFQDISSPAIYATAQSSGRRLLDAEDDVDPIIEDPVFGHCGWEGPRWPYLYLPGLAVSGFESPTALRLIYYECLESFSLRQDLGILLDLGGAMTNSTYVSRFSFVLIPDRFKVRDMFSAYTTCLVGIEHLSKARFRPCVGRLKIKRMIELRLFKMASMFVGANRRTGCKVLLVASDNLFVSSSNFNFATSRSCFEDYTSGGFLSIFEGRSESRIRSLTSVTSESSPTSSFAAILAPKTLHQLFLLVPIEDFLLFCHWFVERRAFPSRSSSCLSTSSSVSLETSQGSRSMRSTSLSSESFVGDGGLSGFPFSTGDFSIGF